jgi:tetratricopeptide (TPR) repeat protein
MKNRPFIPAKSRGRQHAPAHAPKRELNARLAVASLIIAAFFVPTAWGWHYYQVSQQTRSILSRAQKLAKNDEHARSLRYFQQYLISRPDDIDVRIDYAKSLDELGKENPLRVRDATEAYARVLGMAPNDPASKIRYAELLAQLRNLVVTWQISW